MAEDYAERLFSLFAGLSRAHGQYLLPDGTTETGSKVEGRGVTRHAPASIALWQRHLAGSYSLGIVTVREDGTCCWGAIDVDDYTLDLPALDALIEQAGLPLIVCRTKSGGAHLLLFVNPPAKASDVRRKLREWATDLGFGPQTEVFPKQDKVDEDGGAGNWLNMPYFRGDDTPRYAIGDGGRALSVVEFLDLIEARTITEEQLLEITVDNVVKRRRGVTKAKPRVVTVTAPVVEDHHPDLPGGPVCAQTIWDEGKLNSGIRNESLLLFGIYYSRADPTHVYEKLVVANQHIFENPLQDREVRLIAKSVRKKAYGYRCSHSPLVERCDREKCVLREFGVAARKRDSIDNSEPLEFGLLTKYRTQPPSWAWEINGIRVELITEDLLNQRLFVKSAINDGLGFFPAMHPASWALLLVRHMAVMNIVQVPPDATAEGQFWHILARYLTGRAQAKNLDELLLGKPYQTEGRHYFVLSDFLAHIIQQRVRNVDERRVYLWIERRGFEHHSSYLKGRLIAYWSLEEFDQQTEPFEIPRAEAAGAEF